MLLFYSLDFLSKKGGSLLSDINGDSFIVPYPPEDVYGIGVAGPSSTNNNEVNSDENVEKVPEQNNNVKNEEVNNINGVSNGQNGSENVKLEEHLGNNIDTTA